MWRDRSKTWHLGERETNLLHHLWLLHVSHDVAIQLSIEEIGRSGDTVVNLGSLPGHYDVYVARCSIWCCQHYWARKLQHSHKLLSKLYSLFRPSSYERINKNQSHRLSQPLNFVSVALQARNVLFDSRRHTDKLTSTVSSTLQEKTHAAPCLVFSH